MTILFSSAIGSASSTFAKRLEHYLDCKSMQLKIHGGIGSVFIKLRARDILLNSLKLNFLRHKPKLIVGHIFATNYNLKLINHFYYIRHTIISYRNIFDQLNYHYKREKNDKKSPLGFKENYKRDKNFDQNNYDIDLSLLLTLNYYKQWFYLIQNNLIKNYSLFSFQEITTQNDEYKSKITKIFNVHNFENKIVENLRPNEKFVPHERHVSIINEYIKSNKEIDFSLILKK